jgi:hypothetical protein
MTIIRAVFGVTGGDRHFRGLGMTKRHPEGAREPQRVGFMFLPFSLRMPLLVAGQS